jgi:ABC-type lipoprotein export system ATPase subunit
MNPILDIRDLTKTYGAVRAVDGVSLTLQAGEFVSIQGPSGCGKSTLLLAAGGLLRPEAGTVTVAGQDPYALSAEQRAKFRAAHIGFVFQQFHLVPYLNVLDNVMVPALAVPARRERAVELVAQFGLADRAHHVPSQLSVGERQRCALARALLNQPRLLLADEPTGNLDRENGQLVLDCLREFARRGGAVLLVTHDDHASRMAQRAVHLRQGKVVE